MSTNIEELESYEQERQSMRGMDESGVDLNVGDTERIVSAIAGCAAIGGGIYMVARHRPVASAMMGLGGTLLLRRAITGHCNLYDALNINTAQAGEAGDTSGGVYVEERVTINRPPDELYRFWRNLGNLPQIMRHLSHVEVLGESTSRWVARGPAGFEVEWEATITRDIPGELIVWETSESASVPNQGSVRFRKASGDRGTIVEVMLQYRPPAGVLGTTVARLFGREPAQEIREDLRQFKVAMEGGNAAVSPGMTAEVTGSLGQA
jgi:uncharacterized membrane protein